MGGAGARRAAADAARPARRRSLVGERLDAARLDELFDPRAYLVHEDESFRRLGLLEREAPSPAGSRGGVREGS